MKMSLYALVRDDMDVSLGAIGSWQRLASFFCFNTSNINFYFETNPLLVNKLKK